MRILLTNDDGIHAPGLAVLEEIAAQILPAEAKLGYDGQSRTYKDTSNGATGVFVLALVIVYLVLAAQFESFLHPVVMQNGRYMPPAAPGYSIEMKPESIAEYTYPTGTVWR